MWGRVTNGMNDGLNMSLGPLTLCERLGGVAIETQDMVQNG